jgi:hypothetical protein
MEKVLINETFRDELRRLNNGSGEDYINIYKVDGNKVYFKYGDRCRFHITKAELQQCKKETELN